MLESRSMRVRFPGSLFSRLLISAFALVLAAMLLVSATALFLLPPTQADASLVIAFLGVAVLILLLVTAVTYLFARSITRPLGELAQATRAVARGNLEAPLGIRREDEIGALADDFRAMQKDLAASRHALEDEKSRYAELNDLKERLLGNVPHELKTPLSAIAASLEILQSEETILTPAERSELLESIQRAVVRLQYLIDNLLDAASIEAGEFYVRVQSRPLAPLVEEARLFVQPLLLQKGQALCVSDVSAGRRVQADPTRVIQVLINLLSNASKYGEAGADIRVTLQPQDPFMRVSVSNAGDPIPPEEQQKLFERFVRGPRANGLSGVGLGLAIARTIIEMHGGQIGLTSDAAQGTTVWFTLPVANEVEDEDIGRG
jgi:signal transduction histidine kinase